MVASDVHLARGEAKDTVMESMAHVKLPTNGNKQYELDEFLKVQKIIKRVLNETYDELNANGMCDLLESTTNAMNSIKTTDTISHKTVLQESKDEAEKANKAAIAKDASAKPIMPMIPDIEAARAEADRQNKYNQKVVGTKQGMVSALRIIVGAHIIDKIAKTPDGSDFVSIDDYLLCDVIKCAIEHATRPEIEDVLALMSSFYDTEFDFRETVNQNMLKLKEVATRIKQFGIIITEPELMIVLIANINRAAKSGRWGTEFRNTMSTFKKAYPYNHVHDATSMSDVLIQCAEADAARNVRDAPAPGGKALAAHKSILQDALSLHSDDSMWSELDHPPAYGEAYATGRSKSERKRDGKSATSSIASSSDSSSAKTVATAVDCKHCNKAGRTKPHPPKVPVDKCMWNPEHVGYRFEYVCKAMGLKYRTPDKYPRGQKDKWKRHKKLTKKTEA